MSSHIIIAASNVVAPLVEELRNTPHKKLSLQLGSIVRDDVKTYRFQPGVPEDYFLLQVWSMTNSEHWTSVDPPKPDKWNEKMEYYWNDPRLLEQIRGSHKSVSSTSSQVASSHFPRINDSPSNWIKGTVYGRGEENMEYEESIGPETVINLECEERDLSLQVKCRTEKPLNASLAEPVHLKRCNVFSSVRSKTFTYKKCFKFTMSIRRTGTKSVFNTVENGFTSCQIHVDLLKDKDTFDSKNDLMLAAALLEKGVDLLGRKFPYSLKPLSLPFLKTEGSQEKESGEQEDFQIIQENSRNSSLLPVDLIPFV